MKRAVRSTFVAVGVAAMLLGGGASAGRPGAWSAVTDGTGANSDMPGMVRTPDGTLHVVWAVRSDTSDGDGLMHTAIAPDGTVGPAVPIVTGWQRVDGSPDVVVTPDGSLRVFFGGTESLAPGEQNTHLNTATSPADGSAWAVAPVSIATGGQFGGDVGATVGPDGTFFQASETWVHRGLVQSQIYDYHAPIDAPGPGYGGNLATDSETGRVYFAWYSSGGTGEDGAYGGVWVQEVNQASGEPVGEAVQMPATVTTYEGLPYSVNPLGRTAIVARPGGGIYVAYVTGYPSLTAVRVWRVGDDLSTVVARGSSLNESVALASTADGRLWVVYANAGAAGNRIFAKISNATVSAWSPAESVAPPSHPSGYREVYHLQAEAGTRLDILANISNGTQPTTTQFHTQMLVPPAWTAGDDTIAGSGGADLLYGGPGNDELFGKRGTDDVYGGDGDDILDGGRGKDKLVGGKGRDLCIVTKGDRTSGCERTRRNH